MKSRKEASKYFIEEGGGWGESTEIFKKFFQGSWDGYGKVEKSGLDTL